MLRPRSSEGERVGGTSARMFDSGAPLNQEAIMLMIFVNLPVEDLRKSKEFFGALGFEFNPQFSDDRTACMIVEENIYVMLLEPVSYTHLRAHET